MGKKPRAASYLFLDYYGYNFRLSIPLDLVPHFGQKEFRYALKTRLLAEARYRARRMAGFVQSIFRDLRRDGTMMQLTEAELKRLVDNHFREVVTDIEESFLNPHRPLTEEQHEDRYNAVCSLTNDFREWLGRSDHRKVAHLAEVLLQESGFEVDKDSLLFKKLCRELLKVTVKSLEIEEKCLVGDYSWQENLLPPPPPPMLEPEEPSELLGTVIAKYFQEQERGGNWTHRTKFEVQSCLDVLHEVLGDVPVKGLTSAALRDYKQTLMQLPINRGKVLKYRGKTIKELLQMEIDSPLSTTTVNKYMRWTASVFKWAVKNGFIDRNPAEGMKIKQRRRDDELRDVFSIEDLEKLFHSHEYLEDSHRTSFGFWVPIIGLFTGSHLEEICQLHLDDIRQEEGVWVMDINDQGEKRLKTKAAARLVPLHSFLRDDLRLPQYTEVLKGQGHQQLFPELKQQRDGYGQKVSKWFAKYWRRCGIVPGEDKKKDFHSFRHYAESLTMPSEFISPLMTIDSLTISSA
jgi:integrase